MKALWAEELARVRAAGGRVGGEFDRLFRELERRCDPGSWQRYDFSPACRCFRALLRGETVAARSEFEREWRGGEALNRGIHYWNSAQFRTGDRWICAAMLAQLLILFDFLAAEGAFSESEIDAVAAEALAVMADFIEPHNQGRGCFPILHEPINQNAAMCCGMLYAGYCFGYRWRQDPVARRLYGRGRELFADALGQFPENGFDGDGFTYLREIHLATHTLSVALLEKSEGGEWYGREFLPHRISLRQLNARQLDFILPSGYSWPLGRYTYVRIWNQFQQSFAAARTGDPRYLIQAKFDNRDSDYASPWLGLELPLGLLWYPLELNEAVSSAPAPEPPRLNELREHDWAACALEQDDFTGVVSWLPGKAPNFFLEAGRTPLIFCDTGSWGSANGVQPGNYDWGFEGWLTPGGRGLGGFFDAAVQLAAAELTGCYPASAGVRRAEVFYAQLAGVGAFRFDRYCDGRGVEPRLQLLTWDEVELTGTRVRVRPPTGPVLTISAETAPGCEKPAPGAVRLPGRADPGLTRLFWRGEPGRGEFGTLFSLDPEAAAVRQGETVQISSGGKGYRLLLPGRGVRRFDGWETDARFAAAGSDWRVFVDLRRLRDAAGREVFRSSRPVRLLVTPERIRIEGLRYGDFAWYREEPTVHLVIRCGNGVELFGRSSPPRQLELPGPWFGLMLNDRPELWSDKGVTLPGAAESPAPEALIRAAAGRDCGVLIELLHRVRRTLDPRWIPAVSGLLTWDRAEPRPVANFAGCTESTYVRLEAVRTLTMLLAEESIPALLALFRREQSQVYRREDTVWGNQFWGSSTRVAITEALRLLPGGGAALLAEWETLRSGEVVPHVQDGLERVRAEELSRIEFERA